MKILSTLIILATLTAVPYPAQAAPSPDELLDRWIEAIGGRTAWEHLTSREAKGTLEIAALGGMTAVFTYAGKAPNLRLTEVTFSGIGTVRQGFDGETAWSQNPGNPVTRKSGQELEQARREASFRQELDFKKLYPTQSVEGSTTVGKRQAWILKATAANGDTESYYFDTRTGLLLRKDILAPSSDGPVKTEVLLEDYKAVDGVKIPHTLRMENPPNLAFTLRFSEIRHNLTLNDDRFRAPAE